MKGIEPLTCGLRNRCSTAELHRQPVGVYIVTPSFPISKWETSPCTAICAKILATEDVPPAICLVTIYDKLKHNHLEVQAHVHTHLHRRRRSDSF